MTLDQGFLYVYSLKHLEARRGGETKMYSKRPGHMTNMATTPGCCRKYENPLFNHQLTDELGSSYVASGTQELLGLFKWWRFRQGQVDLGVPYFNSVKHLLKVTGPIVSKVHVKPPMA